MNFINNNIKIKDYVIYFNPVHKKVLTENGFVEISKQISYRNGSTFIIFSKRQ